MLRSRRGAAALVFVLIAPPIVGLLVGVADFARVLILRQQLADAAEQIAQAG